MSKNKASHLILLLSQLLALRWMSTLWERGGGCSERLRNPWREGTRQIEAGLVYTLPRLPWGQLHLVPLLQYSADGRLFVSSPMPTSLINSRWRTALKISLKMFKRKMWVSGHLASQLKEKNTCHTWTWLDSVTSWWPLWTKTMYNTLLYISMSCTWVFLVMVPFLYQYMVLEVRE